MDDLDKIIKQMGTGEKPYKRKRKKTYPSKRSIKKHWKNVGLPTHGFYGDD